MAMGTFHQELSFRITSAIETLLNTRHLYQSSEIDPKFVDEIIAAREKAIPLQTHSPGAKRPTPEQRRAELFEIAAKAWAVRKQTKQAEIEFSLPTIHTVCAKCKKEWPFNPVGDQVFTLDKPTDPAELLQIFFFVFQCQSCKMQFATFMVRRKFLKLTICGREPIEFISVPKELSKDASKFFGDSIAAYDSGRTLAALFYLRTFVEQFWRSLPEVQTLLKTSPRATGDEMGTKYQASLLPEIRDGFPSLPHIYSQLSEAMHAANEDAALYEKCKSDIVRHFKARDLYGL